MTKKITIPTNKNQFIELLDEAIYLLDELHNMFDRAEEIMNENPLCRQAA